MSLLQRRRWRREQDVGVDEKMLRQGGASVHPWETVIEQAGGSSAASVKYTRFGQGWQKAAYRLQGSHTHTEDGDYDTKIFLSPVLLNNHKCLLSFDDNKFAFTQKLTALPMGIQISELDIFACIHHISISIQFWQEVDTTSLVDIRVT